jgi:hypothetical protein
MVLTYVLLAVLLLLGAIFNRYFVEYIKTRSGLIAGYTIVFAICVGFVTNAQRAEIVDSSCLLESQSA